MLPTTGGRSACRASAPNGMASAPVKEVSTKRRRSMRGSPPERVRSNGWLGVIFVHALLLSHPALVDSLPGSVRTDHCKPGVEPQEGQGMSSLAPHSSEKLTLARLSNGIAGKALAETLHSSSGRNTGTDGT